MEPVSFEVNPDTCIRCGLCVSDCVCTIIKMGDVPFIAPEDRSRCIRCGHCQAICPTESITLEKIKPQTLAAVAKPVATDVIAGIIRSRRSVRHYSLDPVDQAVLEKAIAIAAWAPTAINFRDMGLIIFNGREKVEKLMRACADVMEKHNLFPEVAAGIRKGQDALFRGAPCVLAIYAPDNRPYVVSDCATTLGALELSLPTLGLASCWTGMFATVCSRELPAGLNLPQGMKIHGGLMIGRPTVKYNKIPRRPIPPVKWV